MTQQTLQSNPFMLMVNPEVVFAAMEASERLGQLHRHLCRPLDRMAPTEPGTAPATVAEEADDDIDLPPEI